MLDKLEKIEKRYQEIETRLSDPQTLQNVALYRDLTKEEAELKPIIEGIGRLKKVVAVLPAPENCCANLMTLN